MALGPNQRDDRTPGAPATEAEAPFQPGGGVNRPAHIGGAVVTPGASRTPTAGGQIPQTFIQRAMQGVRALMRGPGQFSTLRDEKPPPTQRPVAPPEAPASTAASTPLDTGWMGPGTPPRPAILEWSEVAGRAFDYDPATNLAQTPRAGDRTGITFDLLRNLAQNYDLLRLAIETRKNQIAKLGWSIMHRKEPNEQFRKPSDAACRMVEECLRRPDGVHTWDQWIRMVAEDSFVCDGVAVFRRKHPDGRPYALELVDPATIKILIDVTGRSPLPPQPAYSQILRGVPAAQYTRNELSYWKRNPRTWTVYGYSECEQVVRTVMLGLSRMARQMGHYNGANLPDAMLPMPPNWTPGQIAEFERNFLSMMSNTANKRRVHFIPGGVGNPIVNSTEQMLFGQFDEWLARMICYAFSLPPFPFVQQTNKATAQSQYDSALEEGLAPFLAALKAFMDNEIAEFFGQPDLELVWDDVRKLDPTEQYNKDQTDMRSGLASIDDIRAARGMDAAGMGEPLVFGVGPMGFLTVSQLAQMVQEGGNLPMQGLPPDAAAGLANADPALLEQLGIDPAAAAQGAAGAGAGPGGDGAAPADFEVGEGSPLIAQVARRTKTPPEVSALLGAIKATARGQEKAPPKAAPNEEPPDDAADD